MEKIVLKNGERIEIENGAIENCITVKFNNLQEVASIAEKFTETNLEEYKILNSDDLECSTMANKCLESFTIYPSTGRVVFNLKDVDMESKRLKLLEETQELQDTAIAELAEMAAEQEE